MSINIVSTDGERKVTKFHNQTEELPDGERTWQAFGYSKRPIYLQRPHLALQNLIQQVNYSEDSPARVTKNNIFMFHRNVKAKHVKTHTIPIKVQRKACDRTHTYARACNSTS